MPKKQLNVYTIKNISSTTEATRNFFNRVSTFNIVARRKGHGMYAIFISVNNPNDQLRTSALVQIIRRDDGTLCFYTHNSTIMCEPQQKIIDTPYVTIFYSSHYFTNRLQQILKQLPSTIEKVALYNYKNEQIMHKMSLEERKQLAPVARTVRFQIDNLDNQRVETLSFVTNVHANNPKNCIDFALLYDHEFASKDSDESIIEYLPVTNLVQIVQGILDDQDFTTIFTNTFHKFYNLTE